MFGWALRKLYLYAYPVSYGKRHFTPLRKYKNNLQKIATKYTVTNLRIRQRQTTHCRIVIIQMEICEKVQQKRTKLNELVELAKS